MVVTSESVAFLGELKLNLFQKLRVMLCDQVTNPDMQPQRQQAQEMRISHYTPPRASTGQGKGPRALWHHLSRASLAA